MELKGQIIKVMDVVTGVSKKGQWARQDFILEIPGQYPKKVAMSIWGQEKIDKYDLEPGITVTASIEIESREFNDRWYTEIRAWKLEWNSQQKRTWQAGGSPGQTAPPAPEEPYDYEKRPPVTDTDDLLPF